MMKKEELHKIVYKLVKAFLKPYIKYYFRFNFEKFRNVNNNQYIVLSNHTNNWDPLLVGMSFPEHMYYVASEHIFRKGIISKIIINLISPIMRVKAKTERRTAVSIIRTLKDGHNICMFAEGSTTWNGESSNITEATAKLIKISGVSLITYRIEGGYLSRPRWAKTNRRGKISGNVINEYTPNKLSSMTVKEIREVINKDLYVNAYEVNNKFKIEYKGKKLAENLENVLYICPNCKSLGSFKSKDDILSCNCGLELRYNNYGLFESINSKRLQFKTILEWDKWQGSYIKENRDYYINKSKDEYILKDTNQILYKFEPGKSSSLICEGTIYLYSDRLVIEDSEEKTITFNLSDITDIALMMESIMTFTVDGKSYYEVKSKIPRSALKYLIICRELTEVRTML